MASSLSYDRLVAIIEAQNEIASAELDAREVMSLVVGRAQALTGAESVVVELLDGRGLRQRSEMETGLLAPPQPSPTMVRIPIAYRGQMLGALKLYAPCAEGFDEQDVAVFQLLAGLLAPHLAHWPESDRRPPESTLDALTGLPNRRAFEVRLGAEVARVRRHGGNLSLCLADVDEFKEVNDTLGRVVGDEVLRGVARNLSRVRGEDEAFRLRADEFALIFSGVDASGATVAAGRLADAVLADRGCGGVTISWGVAELGGGDPAVLVAEAVEALERAKRAGSV